MNLCFVERGESSGALLRIETPAPHPEEIDILQP